MHDIDEQDTCRICSAPAEPDQPLFHPCKCSGTIRYIHQDCLTTWLSHSKKKTCDVCKHPYSFTKVYAPDMPQRLPLWLVVRRLVQQGLYIILFVIRAFAVACVWLAVLPWATVWTWRMYFSVGETTAWWIANRTRTADHAENINPLYTNLPLDTTIPPPPTRLARMVSHPIWLHLSADIFTGQIIASVIVLAFVAMFLLREWISQNARPGVFEDDDALEEERAPEVVPLPPRIVRQELPLDDQQTRALIEQQAAAVQALDELRSRSQSEQPPAPEETLTQEDEEDEVDRLSAARAQRRKRNASDEEKPDTNEEVLDIPRYKPRRSLSRQLHAARMRRRAAASESRTQSRSPPPSANANFEFNFRMEPTHTTPEAVPTTSGASTPATFPLPNEGNTSVPGPLSFGFERPSPLVPTSSRPTTPRRPILPMTVPVSPGSSRSSSSTPLTSPHIATYRAPEDLDPNQDYFGPNVDAATPETESGDSATPQDLASAHAQYFREPQGEGDDDDTTLHSDSDSDRVEGGAPAMPAFEAINDGGEASESEAADDSTSSEGSDTWDEDEENEDEQEEEEEDEQDEDGEDEQDDALADEAAIENAGAALDAQMAAIRALDDPDNALNPDDAEINADDDMDGVLEAIGMRGPIYNVVQNAALMIFILDTAIGLGIWLPFTIGKSTALLSLDPPRFLQILHLPIQVIRVFTDPVVDAVVYILVHFFLPPYVRLGRQLLRLLTWSVGSAAEPFLGKETLPPPSNIFSMTYAKVLEAAEKPLNYLWDLAIANPKVPSAPVSLPENRSYIDIAVNRVVEFSEPYFAAIGKEVREGLVKSAATWTEWTLGHGTRERLFAIALGYSIIGLFVALYLNILTVGNVRSAGRAVRSAVRQQLLVFKVASFIVIELVTFPLGCGIVLDFCTVWLFPEANLESRIGFFYQAPLTAMFYHWVAGTMFMYAFALLLAGCRSIMRPGAMWFIKDPQDQNAHPIRDILDRSTWTQLRKICVSAVMYSIVVLLVVGSVGGLVLVGTRSILPFRWKNREPLSNVPIDLLFLHLVLPSTMQYFRPKKGAKKIASYVWKVLSHQLRLTSYFFGTREPTEERWGDKEYGTFRRVPATDQLALPRDARATAAVNSAGEPLDPEAAKLIEVQNREAEKAKHNIEDDYMVVYLPPHFSTRIIAFILLFWVWGACILGIAVALPIQLGRGFFNLFVSYEVHDGYSFIVGSYLLWGCFILGRAVDQLDKRRQRKGLGGPRADLGVVVLKRGLVWTAKVVYMIFFLGVVIPTLLSFVVDLYVILPVRLILNPELIPRIRVVDSWALGLMYLKIGYHTQRTGGQNNLPRGINQIMQHGWTNPDPIGATLEVIGPVVGGLIGMILLPAVTFHAIKLCLPFVQFEDNFLFMHIYPAIFAGVSIGRSAITMAGALHAWSQSVRDKEFLVEMRLRNLEPEAKPAPTPEVMPIEEPAEEDPEPTPLHPAVAAMIAQADADAEEPDEDPRNGPRVQVVMPIIAGHASERARAAFMQLMDDLPPRGISEDGEVAGDRLEDIFLSSTRIGERVDQPVATSSSRLVEDDEDEDEGEWEDDDEEYTADPLLWKEDH